jgi:abequosyltransferase
MKLSFCIPSLNRPEYLCQTIKSICSNEKYNSEFEICIYNNFSDVSYNSVEDEIKILSKIYDIKYHIGTSRLNIDQSMYESIKPAIGDYLFFIGDDDYLFDDGLEKILNLIDKMDFDMAIFNARIIDEVNHVETDLIGFSGRKYTQLEVALVELKQFCAYSNILIKREYIIEDDFQYLIGTSHAYGCFWLSFFRNYENDINPVIIIPNSSVVNLRIVKKNYNLLEVVYKHADFEHKLYYDVIGEKSKKILEKFETDFWKKNSSLKQLLILGVSNYDLRAIKELNQSFYNKFIIKILIARLAMKLLKPIKRPIKFILKWKNANRL